MWYEDLTVHYFGGRNETPRIAIGWLHKDYPFKIGETSIAVYEKLCELNENPWLDYAAMGAHTCELCEKTDLGNWGSETKGSRNLTIPHDGKLYHYPEMITHYIKRHSYLPPEEFCEAVLACPPMDSMEYYNKMAENGGKRLVSYFEEDWTAVKKYQNESNNRTNQHDERRS